MEDTVRNMMNFMSAGVTRKNVWIQRSPPGSGAPDLEVVSIETDDPAKMLKEFVTSNHPWVYQY